MEEKKTQEKKYPCKRRTKADGKRLNMYVVMDFKQYRGMTTRMMTDADGDEELCICIPTKKNLIPVIGDGKFRTINFVRRNKHFKGAPFVIVPLAEIEANDAFQDAYRGRYVMIAPKVGCITYRPDYLVPEPVMCSWSKKVMATTTMGAQTKSMSDEEVEAFDEGIRNRIDELVKDR